jgi:hypothetical protein
LLFLSTVEKSMRQENDVYETSLHHTQKEKEIPAQDFQNRIFINQVFHCQ